MSTLILGGDGTLSIKKMNDNSVKLSSKSITSLSTVTNMRANFINLRLYVLRNIASYNVDLENALNSQKSDLEDEIKDYLSINMDSTEMDLFSSYKNLFDDYWNNWLEIRKDLKQGKPISNNRINDLSKIGDDLENILNKLRLHLLDNADNIINENSV